MPFRTYVDGNSVCHAAQHRKGGKLYAGERETTAIFGGLTSFRKLLRNRTFAKPVILWDGRSWRYDHFLTYKEARTNTAEKVQKKAEYKAQRQSIAKGLHLLGVPQLIASNMEADDLVAILTRRALAKGEMVAMITGDQDWIQLVEKGVAWIDHKIDRKVTCENFHEFTGYKTQQAFIESKAMQGDVGDSVPGCGGIGDGGALDLLTVFESVADFQQCSDKEARERYKASTGKNLPKKLMNLRTCPDTQARFLRGLELMDLNHPCIPAPVGLRVTNGTVDLVGFRSFCQEFAFSSILATFDDFVQPFISIQEQHA